MFPSISERYSLSWNWFFSYETMANYVYTYYPAGNQIIWIGVLLLAFSVNNMLNDWLYVRGINLMSDEFQTGKKAPPALMSSTICFG